MVLPVPVAPATSPWRFIIDSATCTRVSLESSPSCIGLPMTIDGSSRAYPVRIASTKASFIAVMLRAAGGLEAKGSIAFARKGPTLLSRVVGYDAAVRQSAHTHDPPDFGDGMVRLA